ncbi:MAG: S41 family peptidase [Muribaculaceae bacterium]|nr:S41 family peptidase [Muribaculaceae bacterium]
MDNNNHQPFSWVPIAIAASLVVGIWLGLLFSGQKAGEYDRKLNNILNLVSNEYVDDIEVDSLIELSIPEILSNLDPHSYYLSAKELQMAEDDLNGSFSGIGISFQLDDDTVYVIEVIPGGPSEKAGLVAGDKIISADGKSLVGLEQSKIMETLRGTKGSRVKLGIKRLTSDKPVSIVVTRGDVPVKAVDASYMIEKNTGYVRVNQFGRTTYDEFMQALTTLKSEGAKRYIVDLRGNGGGYMEMAIYMANEFLPANQLIVSTKGRYKNNDTKVWSDGNGSFKEDEIIVLIDEFSASASEIFAGAIQDNDRGLIVGCRSFGKGLVQKQFDLGDKSAIRLTIARYYTPSGRCIQKDYKAHGLLSYEKELYERYKKGELYNQDSIKTDKKQQFKTMHGRTVYGGGGIIPDIFVPQDTTAITSYYISISNAGLIPQFVLKYVQSNRGMLKVAKDYKQLLRMLNNNEQLLNDFVDFAAQHGVPARWYYINLSKDLIIKTIKALIARDLFGQSAFYPIYNRNDNTVEAALKAFSKHQATFPILPNN